MSEKEKEWISLLKEELLDFIPNGVSEEEWKKTIDGLEDKFRDMPEGFDMPSTIEIEKENA